MSMNTVPNLAGGGEPPYDKGMDRRLIMLETRFDTILPTLATKTDLEALPTEVRVGFEQLRADQLRMHNDLLKWIIGMFLSLFIGMIGSNAVLFNLISHMSSDRHPVGATAEQGSVVVPAPLQPPVSPPQASPTER